MTEAISEILRHLESRKFGEPMQRALLRVLEGESYRSAAEAEGIDPSDLHRAARTVPGLVEAHLAAWRDGWGGEFPSMWRQHLKRIEPRNAIPRRSREHQETVKSA